MVDGKRDRFLIEHAVVFTFLLSFRHGLHQTFSLHASWFFAWSEFGPGFMVSRESTQMGAVAEAV